MNRDINRKTLLMMFNGNVLPVKARGILDYWLGGDIALNYSQKWFVSPDNKLRDSVDEYILKEYGDLLRMAEENIHLFFDWKQDPLSFVALIILVDQFSRHVYRHDERSRISSNDKIALLLSQEFVTLNYPDKVPSDHLVFALMPFRHDRSQGYVGKALEISEKRFASDQIKTELLQKFIKTTHRKLLEIEGRVGDPDDILEHAWFDLAEKDKSSVYSHILTKAVASFIQKRTGSIITTRKTVFVSLSGGVDSMVICFILHCLSRNYTEGLDIIAIHINYNNRQVSGSEESYVRVWCERYGIVFRAETIIDFKRGETHRDEYEKETRMLRYNFYKKVLSEFNCDPNTTGILVGHHQGDVQENVISNIMKGSSLLELRGMGEESTVNGVCIWRPLLDYYKRDIFAFAHQYGVPYFKDTTPKWSNRGKLRRTLMPLLEEMFGPGYLTNLTRLSHDSIHVDQMVRRDILVPFWSKLTEGKLAVWIDCNNYAGESVFFWKEALRHICHNVLGVGLISEQSCRVLIERINNNITKASKQASFISLRKDYRTLLDNTTLVFLKKQFMRPSRYSPNTNAYFENNTLVQLNVSARFGPYTLYLSQVDTSDVSPHDLSSLSIYKVLQGCFIYYIPRSDTYQLISSPRPAMLKQVTQELCSAIPLVQGSIIGQKVVPKIHSTCIQVSISFM